MKRILPILLCASMAFGTVPQDSYAPENFSPNGSTTAYTFTFKIFQTSDLVVELYTAAGVKSTLVENNHYSVSATNNDFSSGGVITTTTAYASGTTLTASRDTALTQESEFISNRALEYTLDRGVLGWQEIQDLITRTPRAPVTDTSLRMELPVASVRAGGRLGFDASGNVTIITADVTGVPASPFAETFLDDLTAQAVRTTLNTISVYNVLDYGAAADGVTDDTAAFQSAIDGAEANNGTAYAPTGTYKITSKLLIDNPITFKGDNTVFSQYGSTLGTIILAEDCNGIDIQCNGATVRDLTIKGDRTSGWGIRMGASGQAAFGTRILNVLIFEKGAEGLLINGTSAYSQFSMHVYNCVGDGVSINLLGASFFNGNTFHYLNTHFNDGDGISFASAAGSISLNQFNGFSSENNTGWGINFTSTSTAGTLRGNQFAGYGCETNTAGNFTMPDSNSEGGHLLIMEPQNERATFTLHTGQEAGYGGLAVLDVMRAAHAFDSTEGIAQFKIHSNTTPALYAENSAAGAAARFMGSIDGGADGATRGILTLWDGAGGTTPGYIKLHSPDGTAWYLFVEDDGTLKIHNAVPTQNSDGSVVGGQT